jgi:hypothetical protein
VSTVVSRGESQLAGGGGRGAEIISGQRYWALIVRAHRA